METIVNMLEDMQHIAKVNDLQMQPLYMFKVNSVYKNNGDLHKDYDRQLCEINMELEQGLSYKKRGFFKNEYKTND